MRVLISLLASIVCTQLWAAPPSLQQLANTLQLDQVISLGVFDELDEIIAEAESKPRAPMIIGAHRLIDLDTTNGQWQNLNNGNQLWQLALASSGAKSVSALFDQFELADGAKLWVYSADRIDVLGPFTNADQNTLGEFWTPYVDGDTLMIELEQPNNSTSTLHISALDHGLKNWRNDGNIQHKAEGDSGSCNVNVACSSGSANASKSNATAQLLIPDLLGTKTTLCTGTLINNTDQDRTPYFLTANHCLSSNTAAARARTRWEFQADSCNGNTSGTSNQTVNVASMVATWPTSDFTLLRLISEPQASYSPYWAGWDRTGTNLRGGVGVHHPQGDLKKISTTSNTMAIVNGSGGLNDSTNVNGQYVRVSPWRTGTTEGGSSGSGLWNSNNRLVGQLSAGNASCSASNGQDFYGWIGQSWDGGGTAASRLKDWLAPNQPNVTTLDGCDHVAETCTGGTSTTPPTGGSGSDSGSDSGGGGGGSSALLLLVASLSLGLRRRLLKPAKTL